MGSLLGRVHHPSIEKFPKKDENTYMKHLAVCGWTHNFYCVNMIVQLRKEGTFFVLLSLSKHTLRSLECFSVSIPPNLLLYINYCLLHCHPSLLETPRPRKNSMIDWLTSRNKMNEKKNIPVFKIHLEIPE